MVEKVNLSIDQPVRIIKTRFLVMEILSVLLIILFAVLFLKVFSFLLHTGIFILTLPIKILSVVLATVVVFALLLPLGVVGVLAGLLVTPLVLLVILLPFFLIIYGIYLLVNRS